MIKDIRKIIEKIISLELEIINEEISDDNTVEDLSEPLYHITYYGRLEAIDNNGLVPGSGRSIGSMAYDSHASKGIFLTEHAGIGYWYSKAEEFAEHRSDNPLEDLLVPVVLKIDQQAITDNKLRYDDAGIRDALYDAYIYQGNVEPEYIDIWDGNKWIGIEDWGSIDPELALDKEEIEGEDGNPEEYYLFKYDNENPLVP